MAFLLADSGSIDDVQFFTVDQIGVTDLETVWPSTTLRQVKGLSFDNPIREVRVDAEWAYGYQVPDGTRPEQLEELLALLLQQHRRIAVDADLAFVEQDGDPGSLIKQDALWPVLKPFWREGDGEDK